MRCLTVCQPWATLLMTGQKHYETRAWRPRETGRIAIHASRRFYESVRALCLEEPYRSALGRAGFTLPSNLPRGVILGTIELVACLPTECIEPTDNEKTFTDFRPGRFAWEFANPQQLVVPVPFSGRLGLFEVPEDLLCSSKLSG